MKRLIGTFVLFGLLVLTVVALNNVSSADALGSSAVGRIDN